MQSLPLATKGQRASKKFDPSLARCSNTQWHKIALLQRFVQHAKPSRPGDQGALSRTKIIFQSTAVGRNWRRSGEGSRKRKRRWQATKKKGFFSSL
jgi:hypothetical protein